MKTLIVVESPAKCSKISGFLGPQYVVKASFGHIRDMPDGLQSIDCDHQYAITYGIMDSKKRQVAELKKAYKECGNLMVAGDPDREGEAICFHIAVVLGVDPTTVKRIKFQEITKTAIVNAVANPGRIDMSLVRSQEARRVLDLLVGYEISPLVSQFIGGQFSAGRCQSPAVRLVAERERDIEQQDAALGTSQYHIDVVFQSPDGLTARFKKSPTQKPDVMQLYQQMMNSYFQVNDFQTKRVEHSPPKPYTTSTIQQDCSSMVHMSPKETMSILQKLYEAGKITYMRTDSVVLSKEALAMIGDEVRQRYDADYYQYREYKNKNSNAQEAHEAIRPTHLNESPLQGEWSHRETRVYDLIWRRTMASQMANQRMKRHMTTITMYWKHGKQWVPHEDQLQSTVDQLEFDGWRVLYKKGELDDVDDVHLSHVVADITVGMKLYYQSASAKQTYQRAIGRYTEASLIKELEHKGIGRPSTYANIMETIIRERNYVDVQDFQGVEKEVEEILLTSNEITTKHTKTTIGKEKKKLTIHPVGKQMVSFLMEHFDNIMNYDFTKQVEEELDLICEGKSTYSQIVDRVYGMFHPKVVELKKSKPKMKKEQIELGAYDDGNGEEPVFLKSGPYGYYLVYRGENYGLKYVSPERREKVVHEDLEEAVAIIEEQLSAKKREIIQVGEFTVKKGPYGFYFQHKKKNYSIGQRDPDTLTEEICNEIINTPKKPYKKFTKT